jgi:lipopolysaccharide export system protein LptA
MVKTISQAGVLAKADSCAAITQAEAGAALGRAVKPPVHGKASVEGGVVCVFYGPSVAAGTDPDVPVGDSVRVVLVKGPQAEAFFADYRKKVRPQAVTGLGDQAFYDGYASLSVLKGDAYVRIAVIGVRDVLGAEKMLAADAIQRMK